MKVLLVAMRYDYGDVARGPSFEEANFHDTLKHMAGVEVQPFDFMAEAQSFGREAMNENLYLAYRSFRPDLMFFMLFRDEIFPETVQRISDEALTTTYNWFADDHWRFDDFSRYWAPRFHWSSTTSDDAGAKYARLGLTHVLKTQWGFSQYSYGPTPSSTTYDITFVGQPHGSRRQTIQSLIEAGVPVRVWGHGWDSGRLSQEGLVKVFSASRVNLNLTNSSVQTAPRRWRVMVERLIGKQPGFGPGQQIKARHFEIPGCGGFQLSAEAESINEFFVLDEEIVLFRDRSEMIAKSRYFLRHDMQRSRIAAAGHARAVREHTYDARFASLFRRMGFIGI